MRQGRLFVVALSVALLGVAFAGLAQGEPTADLRLRSAIEKLAAPSRATTRWHEAREAPTSCTALSARAVVPADFYNYDGLMRSVRRQFTAKLRDYESGLNLDYFGARYYASAMGRFTSPDAPFNDQFEADPQSWNLYSYTRNNPLKYVDNQGEWLESAWDVANVVWGVKSLVSNVRSGNYGAAALDAGGVVLDTAAVIVPAVPGGAGALIKAGRVAGKADDAVDALRKGGNVLENARNGLRREQAVAGELAQQYGDDAVQGQQLLRNAEGAKAVDPVTGTGRRIDHVVIQDGTPVRSVETTSPTASKRAQGAKESRIREAGGTFVRDRNTGRLVNIEDIPTEEIRVP